MTAEHANFYGLAWQKGSASPNLRSSGAWLALGLLRQATKASPSCSFWSVTDSTELQVEVTGPHLIVSGGGFCAVYYKLTDQQQLMLRLRTKTDDYELLARAWMVANTKARELGVDRLAPKPRRGGAGASRSEQFRSGQAGLGVGCEDRPI